MYDEIRECKKHKKDPDKAVRQALQRIVRSSSRLLCTTASQLCCAPCLYAHAFVVCHAQLEAWQNMYDELERREDKLTRKLADAHCDLLRGFYSERNRKEVERASLDPKERKVNEEVSKMLDVMRPVEKSLGDVSFRQSVGASGFCGTTTRDDAEEGFTVDVLGECELMENDKQPDVIKQFKDEDDKMGDSAPIPYERFDVVKSGALWSQGFRFPPSLATVLMDHQVKLATFILKRLEADAGTLVAHAMGLGKSLSTLAALSVYSAAQTSSVTRILLIAPKTMVNQWMDETCKWDGVTIDAMVLDNNDAHTIVRTVKIWKRRGGILIVGHQQMCVDKDGVRVGEKLDIDEKTIIIVDEAHLIKSPSTEMYKMME
eukprot:7261184-Prymnesium_polylepis.1